MPTTSRRPRPRSPAPPGRWASRSASSSGRLAPVKRTDEAGEHLAPPVHQARETRSCRTKARSTQDAAKRFDRTRAYAPGEAMELVRSLAHASFDETVEMAVRLGVDPRKADQVVRGTVVPARRHRQTGAGGRLRRRGGGRGSPGGGGRRGRRRRSGGSGRRRVHGLRRGHRHPRPDGPGRPARPQARAPGPHAQPQDGHGHRRRRARP